MGNAARFAYGVYEGLQRIERTMAVAVALNNAHNRVQFKLLRKLIVQYCVSFELKKWLTVALYE